MIKFKPKITSLLLSIITVIIGSTSAFAYGPKRSVTFTMEKPASYVTFNSITNNPVVGDERDFVRVKELGTDKYVNSLEISAGKTYEIYAAYHNNAAANLNTDGRGIAKNTRMRGIVPKGLLKTQKTLVSVQISADNANPKAVWDEVSLTAKEDVAFKYIDGSATIHTNYKDKFGNSVNGQKLTGLLTEKGALIGASKLDGLLPGCGEFSGHITFQIAAVSPAIPKTPEQPKPKTPEAKITKEISILENEYQKEAETKDTENISYKITIENTGEVDIKNLKLEDKLPSGMEIVKGSIKIDHGDGKLQDANSVNQTFESIKAGQKITIYYKVSINDVKCGDNALENVAAIKYSDKDMMDSAKLNIKKECEAPVTPPPAPKTKIPETGPAEVVLVATIIIGLAGGLGYFIYSKKLLKNKMQKAMGVQDITKQK